MFMDPLRHAVEECKFTGLVFTSRGVVSSPSREVELPAMVYLFQVSPLDSGNFHFVALATWEMGLLHCHVTGYGDSIEDAIQSARDNMVVGQLTVS